MPLLSSTYTPPRGFSNAHLQTVWAGRLRRVDGVAYERERIGTPDGDFLDLDWVRGGHGRCAVVTHGLEGSAARPYVRGMARALSRRGWDVCAWNLRGCSGEPNRHLPMYHSGATYDLDTVVQHALGRYDRLALVGFSLGGNLTLKFLGERAVDPRVERAVALSVPVDLAASSGALARWTNGVYMLYFLRSLRRKVQQKAARFPDEVETDGLWRIRSFRQFDDRYTAPMHGFDDAADYWARSSSRPFLSEVRTPTLLINAADDPFLAPTCYPEPEARASAAFHLEQPAHGGHVGFVTFGGSGDYWSERRAAAFLAGQAEGLLEADAPAAEAA
ncbi:MAG: alpha/beta fold hydrolase [Rhodothermales bacterium]|nr:alpha/beta fold hydrolase [Rhodothermales bacterium]